MIYLESYSNFTNKGVLIPIGGAESKGDSLEANESILSEIVKSSKFGTKSNIIIIPTASSYQNEIDSEYSDSFKKLGCGSIKTLFINSKDQVDSESNLGLLEGSNIVMFSGGDQSRISECFLGTKFLEGLKNKYLTEHFVIAGTSAGAMCMSENMITGGKDKAKSRSGLCLVPELIIDSHFTERLRHSRLSDAICKYPNRIGLGLSENTAVVIKGKKFRVIGTGTATILTPSIVGELTQGDIEHKVLYPGDISRF